MKILVYGAGAIGGYLGGRLFQYGNDVTLLSLPFAIEPIIEHGLTISEADETVTLQPPCVVSLAEAFADGLQFDLILVTMKSYDLAAACAAIFPFIKQPTVFMTVGNGIGVERPFIEQFGPSQVLAGSLTTPVRKANDHHLIIERPDRGLGLAMAQPGLNVSKWVQLFNDAHITTIGADGYESMKWSKAFLNIVGNATSAILNRPPGEVYQMPGMFDVEVAMLRETVAVMDKKKLTVMDLPGSAARQLAFGVRRVPKFLLKPILTKIVAGGRGEKMPSFQIELALGSNRSEVIFHNGAIAEAGKKVGIPTPVNAALNAVLMQITTGEVAWAEYDGQAQRLIERIVALHTLIVPQSRHQL